MVNSQDNEAQRRAFFRLPYPHTERPSLMAGDGVYPVSEISEGGMRVVALDQGDVLAQQHQVQGVLRLNQTEVAIHGRVLRQQGEEVVLVLSEGIPLSLMVSEQRRLIQKYPLLFGRES